jgi:hypothetical protein
VKAFPSYKITLPVKKIGGVVFLGNNESGKVLTEKVI